MLTIGINRVFHLNNYHNTSLRKQKDSGSWLAFVPHSQVYGIRYICIIYIHGIPVHHHTLHHVTYYVTRYVTWHCTTTTTTTTTGLSLGGDKGAESAGSTGSAARALGHFQRHRPGTQMEPQIRSFFAGNRKPFVFSLESKHLDPNIFLRRWNPNWHPVFTQELRRIGHIFISLYKS